MTATKARRARAPMRLWLAACECIEVGRRVWCPRRWRREVVAYLSCGNGKIVCSECGARLRVVELREARRAKR